MTALPKLKPRMTAEEFYDWDGGGPGNRHVGKVELVHGALRMQSYASGGHGTIQGNLAALIRNHLRAQGKGCRVGTEVGVIPTFDPTHNVRKPDMTVTCVPHTPGELAFPKPILVVEVLSPSNQDDTWESIQACSTIGSIKEILVIDSEKVDVRPFTQGTDGMWPEDPLLYARGATLQLTSIGLVLAVDDIYSDIAIS
jgi:Uma2 family endonuclease